MVALLKLSNFIKELRGFLSEEQILDKDIDRYLYDTDASSLFKNQAALITIPNSTQELSKIIKLINKYPELSFVARGAGTGLSGGAIAESNSVIISIAKLNKLIACDEVNQMALVETGLVNAALSQQITETGLHFSPDPSSQASCTIGGNIAENAGGIHCYKHGVSADQILGLEVVLPSGEIIYLGQINEEACKNFDLSQKPGQIWSAKRSAIDFTKLFVGSEGTFGIATKALVKLQRIPESFITMQVAFASAIEAAELVSAIIKAGFKPTALEMIDRGALEAVTKAYDLGLPPDSDAVLIIELDGHNEEILFEAKQIKALIDRDFKVLVYKETQNPDERKFLWTVRKGTVAAFGQLAPFWYLYDLVVPRSKIPQATKAIEAIAKKYDLRLASVFHAADGNLHPNFLYDPEKDPGAVDRIHKASDEIMALCVELGGTLSGEHGIGIEKRDYMPLLFSNADMQAMLKVRRVFDPKMISNPNKIFPVRVCKEC